MNRNIFLTGFMGSGKSYWGNIWAKIYGLHFYDLDAQIELETEMSVEQIFEKKGEDEFRKIENANLKMFEDKNEYLLSCGGGTPCFYDNLKWMKAHGLVIYLKGDPDYLMEKVMDETQKRPLLKEVNQSELLFFIQTKLKEREPFYNQAHHILEVKNLNEDSLLKILSSI